MWNCHRKSSKVLEGHHPRGTTLREALRGNLPLRGLCGGLSEVLRGSLRGFCGGPRGSTRVFRGSDPMLVTLPPELLERALNLDFSNKTSLRNHIFRYSPLRCPSFIGEGQKGTPKRGGEEKRQKMS